MWPIDFKFWCFSGKKGIYSLNSSSPTWAIGHGDIFLENKCSAGCHYNAPGLESIDLWVLD